MTEQKARVEFKVFDMYDIQEVKVHDSALQPYVALTPKLLIKSHGRRNFSSLGSIKVHILERLANHLQVPGHVGKKHKIITSSSSGKYNRTMDTLLKTLQIIAAKTKQNPVQVLISAIEKGSPRDEITVIEQGGARYPQAVDCSPVRRINLALRWMVQGAYGKAFGKKKKMADTLADEIIKASEGSMDSYAFSKKNESEKQADSAR